MIAQHLHALLRAALPPEVPVLLPEQAQEPLTAAPTDAQGRPRVGGGERGLGAYLTQHPGGYVQVWHETGTYATDVLDFGQVNIEAIAATLPSAQALAAQIRAKIGGRAVAPTPYRYVSSFTDEQVDFTRVVLTFETRAIGV